MASVGRKFVTSDKIFLSIHYSDIHENGYAIATLKYKDWEFNRVLLDADEVEAIKNELL